MQETGLVRYDAMCHAIAEAHRVDEVKDLRDKALALERYAAQAMNTEAERKACEIRLRAERRAGALLKEQAESGERATRDNCPGPGRGLQKVSRDTTPLPPTLADIGISRDQSSKWQKLAAVPEDEFEDALRDPDKKPSTASIIRKINGQTNAMHPSALWLWGRIRDFERDRIDDLDPQSMVGEFTETMAADARRIIPSMLDYLAQLGAYLDE